jgi:predicted nucleotidyltransferase
MIPSSDLAIPRQRLVAWAATKPTIRALHVFGSYARGEARPDSDLDIAVEFTAVDDDLAELIFNCASWKAELTALTGIIVKDIYLATDAPPRTGSKICVHERLL